MAPQHTALSIRLTEPVVFLTGGQEHERARARRRRAARTQLPTAAAANSATTSAQAGPSSRDPSPAPGPERGRSPHFVPPGPLRTGRSVERGRDYSPRFGPGGDSRSRSRGPARDIEPVPEDAAVPPMRLTTGSGTIEEAEAADEPPPAMLRGLLTLTLAKPSRIRDITLKFRGLSRTDWPEGIGPRRLDVMEETVLISATNTFFSATDLTSERRATSVGPGVSMRDASEASGERGRAGGRRAASMMPTRETSVGRAYTARDSAIHDHTTTSATTEASPLSRIASSADLHSDSPPGSPYVLSRTSTRAGDTSNVASPRTSIEMETSNPPPVGPDEPSPSYTEAISSPTPSLHRPSILSSSRHSSSDFSPVPGSSRASSLLTEGSSDPDGYSSAPVADTIPETSTIPQQTVHETAPSTFQARNSSNHRSPLRRSSSASNHTLRDPSTSSAPRAGSSRLGKPSSRFSLAGLTESLRHKSSSRTRASSSSVDRRSVSPDTARNGIRSQSRGRGARPASTTTANGVRSASRGYWGGADEDSDEEDATRARGWREFRAGTYTYPIAIPIPASLPPSLQAEFGHVSYALKATVHRAGALTPNLSTTVDVLLVSCPGQDDTEENESIVVERFWETQMKYHIALSGKSFPIGGQIPISIRLHPMAKVKLYRVTAILEQKTSYFAHSRKLTRHEPLKKYPMMRIEHKDPKDALLPIFSDEPDAIKEHPLADFFINPTSSEDMTPSCLDTLGPWMLESHLQLPDCSTKVNFSTIHDKANMNVSHVLKIMLRVERGDDDFLDSKGKRKLWDVIIESPIHILSCRCTQNILPAYSSAPSSSLASTTNGFGAPVHDCGFNHAASATIRVPHNLAGQHFSRSSATPSNPPPIATLEQNLLFARLVAGEETPAGEVPPTYDAVISGAGMQRTRSEQSDGTTTTTRGRSRTGINDSAEEVGRGRSNSIVRGVAASRGDS